MRITGWIIVAGCLPLASGETCFHTVQEAARQTGVQDGEGFRLEGIRFDLLGGGRWARVANCLHPERPGTMLKLQSPQESSNRVTSPSTSQQSVAGRKQHSEMPSAVLSGSAVRIVKLEDQVRMELAGVAQEAGALGARIHVRIGSGNEEHFVSAIVRGESLVELESAR